VNLTFFSELPGAQFKTLISGTVLQQLSALNAGIAVATLDLSDDRAQTIALLNQNNIPVTCWILLPESEGYFSTHFNSEKVSARFREVHAWIQNHALKVEAIGLDFEPHINEVRSLFSHPIRQLWHWKKRAATIDIGRVKRAYKALISEIESLGYRSESYQFPLLHDDRAAKSDTWQKIAGCVDVKVQREVTMLYSSLFGFLGSSLVAGYGNECQAIGIGSTGGGIDPLPKLSFDELILDLKTALHFADNIYLFSLEGCVEQGFLSRLNESELAATNGPTSTLLVARKMLQWISK
jgi:hypothetical protein